MQFFDSRGLKHELDENLTRSHGGSGPQPMLWLQLGQLIIIIGGRVFIPNYILLFGRASQGWIGKSVKYLTNSVCLCACHQIPIKIRLEVPQCALWQP